MEQARGIPQGVGVGWGWGWGWGGGEGMPVIGRAPIPQRAKLLAIWSAFFYF